MHIFTFKYYLLPVAFGIFLYPLLAFSQAREEVCAEVSIQIKQELTLERQGFEATLEIENVLEDRPLKNISIDVLFNDAAGETVLASSDPNNSKAQFFVRLLNKENTSTENGSDSVLPQQKATYTWLIVPAPGAASGSQSGTLYWVGAEFNYLLDGKPDSIEVVPDSIYVKPMPTLALDYFIPEYVYSDNPFTKEVEPKEPFPLCVLVSNRGNGVAKKLKIESAQPEIVENTQNLLVQFEILGATVNDSPIQPTLLADFGDIPGHTTKTACWQMQTSLSGKFKNFKASYSHADELGGNLTSLLSAVNTHTLIRRILLQLPGHDQRTDILANDAGIFRVYDTSGGISEVSVVELPVQALKKNLLDTMGITTNGLTLLKVPLGTAQPTVPAVMRNDGKQIASQNIWISKAQIGNSSTFNYTLNIFDNDPKGSYTLDHTSKLGHNQPPKPTFIPLQVAFTGETMSFAVNVVDPDGDPLTFLWDKLPAELSVTPLNTSQLNFNWIPNQAQVGRYQIPITISDGQHQITQSVFIDVRSSSDRDGDGMPDKWEIKHFGDLTHSVVGDFDKDGINNLDEFLTGSNPVIPDGPAAPKIITPSRGVIETDRPELIIKNSEYDGRHNVVYEFEIYNNVDDSSPLAANYQTPQGENGVSTWHVEQPLEENQTYNWRVRANNGYVKSLWSYGGFTVNQINEAPGAVSLASPEQDAILDQASAVFRFNQSSDPDGDALVYSVELYSDDSLEQLILSSDWIVSEDALVEWPLADYLAPSQRYVWRVVAADPSGIEAYSELRHFVTSESAVVPNEPVLVAPENGVRVTTATPALTFEPSAAQHDGITYRLEIDTSHNFDSVDLQSYLFDHSSSSYNQVLPELKENTDYFWRVRAQASDSLSSEWIQSRFFVNAENNAPELPAILNPGNSAWVSTLQPQLAVHPVTDIDRDTIQYEFELFSESDITNPVSQQLSDSPDTVIDHSLIDNQWYAWQVRAVDETGAHSDWSPLQRFFTDSDGINDKPHFEWTISAKPIIHSYPHNITLTWKDTDQDSNANIELYYKKEDSELEHSIVSTEENKDGEFDTAIWQTTSLTHGIYRVYARISDERHTHTVEAPFIYVLSSQYIPPGRVTFVDNSYLRLPERTVHHSAGIVLTKQPFTEVIVKLENHSKGGSLSGDTLIFTPENWSIPQFFTYNTGDDCTYQWHNPIKIVPKVVDHTDPHYPPARHRALLGHVLNDEPETSFSPLVDICSFTLVNSEKQGARYIQTYDVTVKSKYKSALKDLELHFISRNPYEVKVISGSLAVDNLNAGQTTTLTQRVSVSSRIPDPISASRFNWVLRQSEK